jgi:uncharacterized protein YtpQ (UPF0354 family)
MWSRLLCALVLVAALNTAGRAQAPSPSAFTAQFARALQAAMPFAKIRVIRDLQIDVERPDGSSASVSLVNNYKDYTPDPEWFEAVIKAYAAALTKPLSTKLSTKVDHTRIVPLVKDRAWLAGLQRQFKKQGTPQQPVFEDLNKELVVVYAEDTDDRTRYLSSLEISGFEPNKLRELAIENLMRLMPRIEMRQLAEGAFMITSHADYGASLVLVDSIWSGDQIKVNGDIVVAVPAKDVILATGSRDSKNLKSMRQLASDLAKGSGGLIDTFFVYRKGQFVRFVGD